MNISLKERILELIEDYNVVRRTFIWGPLILLLGFAIYGPYKLTTVTGKSMGPNLGSGEYFGAVIPEKMCVGDFLRINEKPRNRIIVRSAIAFGGAQFELTENGYSIDGIAIKMSETWLANASKKIGPNNKFTIPVGKILVMRTAPDAANADNYEAYLVISASNVDRVLGRILVSLNPLRIGKSLRSESKMCVPF